MLIKAFRKAVSTLLGILLFLPNLTPTGPLFRSEIFPWAFLYSLRRSLQITWPYIIFVAYLSASALWMLPRLESPLVPARALFAFINATLIFFTLLFIGQKEWDFLSRVVIWILILQVFVSLLQFLGIFPKALVPVMRFFIERFTAEIFGGGRGVAGLYAEPSYAAVAVHYFVAFILMAKRIPASSPQAVAMITALAFYNLFIIRSFVGLVMFLIYLVSLFNRRQLLWALAISMPLLLTMVRVVGPREEAPRAIALAYNLIYEQEYSEFVPWLVQNSGYRFVAIWGSYIYGIIHPFGGGVGGWSNASIAAMEGVGFPAETIAHFASEHGGQFESVRPTAFAAGLMLESGIVGLILFLIAFLPFLLSKKLWTDRLTRPIATFFVFNTFALGSIGDPVPFAILALTLNPILNPHPHPQP